MVLVCKGVETEGRYLEPHHAGWVCPGSCQPGWPHLHGAHGWEKAALHDGLHTYFIGRGMSHSGVSSVSRVRQSFLRGSSQDKTS
jgi:hypothetical protein